MVLLGPPAVGKMTVGQAIAQQIDYKLFHNHHSIELALPYLHFMQQRITITTTDKIDLHAFLYEPKQPPKGAILINPGLGIPKEFYQTYAAFLAERGYVSLVYDYRGIAQSGENAKNKKAINLRNWGIIDMVATIDYLHQNYPTQKIYFIGHSIGGQIAGLAKNHHLVERFIFVATTHGYWPLFNFPLNLFSAFMWYLHIPITANLFGYMPPSLTYRGIRMAKGVALEWAAWSRKKEYIAHYFGKNIPTHFYEKVTQNIDVIRFEDDPIAIPKTVHAMMDYYKNATIKIHSFNPKKMGEKRVGHSGFFNAKLGRPFWELPLTLIEGG